MKTKLQADTIHGVFVVDELEAEVLDQDDFFEALPMLAKDRAICAEVDEETLKKIEEEFGIQA